MFNRTCALDECDVQFQTDNPRKTHCCHEHANRAAVRSWRARHRKKGGGGGGNGGGGGPTLFDTITPQGEGPIALTLPDICYRTPDRKPAESVGGEAPQKLSRKQAA